MQLSEFIKKTCNSKQHIEKSQDQERFHAALARACTNHRDFRAIPIQELARPSLKQIGCVL